MSPRRLLAFLAVFLVVGAAYFLVTWSETRKELAEQAAKRLYQVKEADITTLTLKKGTDAIQLERKDQAWQITRPIQAKADQDIVRSLLTALAFLNKNRELGQEKDLKPFGLDNPAFILEFMANSKAHHLLVGSPTPGNQGFYVLKDQNQDVMVISSADKQSLDRPLTALRDKRLVDFPVDKVKGLKIRIGSFEVDLEKTAPATWQWLGRDQFKVRTDRVESLLRRLDLARIKEFVSEAPSSKDLAAFGLAPRPKGEVTLEQEKQKATIILGDPRKDEIYARKGSAGPVFVVEDRLKKDLEKAIAGLEDRRLWSGQVADVHEVTWGAPAKIWTAVKEEKSWQLTGPGKETLSQSTVHLEMALLKFQDLEYARLVPAAKPSEQKKYLLELRDASGNLLLQLIELSSPEKDNVEVNLERQGKVECALVPLKPYQAWQEHMAGLTRKTKENK
jgi:hypothetical protein